MTARAASSGHAGDFVAQCNYAYDKIKRALAANGSSLKDAVKMTVYVTDMRYPARLGEVLRRELRRRDRSGADAARHQRPCIPEMMTST